MKFVIKVFLSVFICFVAISCKNKAYREARKLEWALQQKVDSFSKTDVKLSFMGIDIGGDVNQIEEAIKKGKIDNVVDSNGVYIGNVIIPYDANDAKANALIRIMTIDKKIAAIELAFKNQHASRFFVETFQERYYNDDKLQRYQYGSRDYFLWDFKEQYVCVREKRHGEPQETIKNGKYNIERVTVYDATYVEYYHKHLYDQVCEIANKEKAAKDSANVATQDSIVNNEKRKEEELKKNI